MTFSPYSSYKDSGTEWIGVVPQYWSVMSLRHAIIDIISGITTEQIDESPETIRVTRIETISKGVVNYDKLAFFSSSKVDTSRKLMKGDVLFSNINSLNMIGNCAHFSGGSDLYVGMNLLALRPQSPCAGKWLYWLTSSDQFRCNVEALAKPAINQASISQSAIASIRIPFPTIDEQQSIAAFLDRETSKIDALVVEQERLLALLAEKRQAVISRAVTQGLDPSVPMKDSGVEWMGRVPAHWELFPLRRVVQLVTERAEEKTFPVALENVEGWTGRLLEGEADYSAEGIRFYAGDVLFGKLRPYLAKVWLADTSGEAIGDFHVLRCRQCMVPAYLQIFLLTQQIISLINSSSFGTKMPRASWGFIGTVVALRPPTEEQQAIAAFLNRETTKIDVLVSECLASINLLRERRSTLISAAVTGKIDVRGLVPITELTKEVS